MQKEKEFRELIHRHKDLIWHVCEDYSLSAAWTTDDTFQEVLCQIWKSMGQFNGNSSERTWVYRVAVNTILSIKRKKSNQPSPRTQLKESSTRSPSDLFDLERLIELLGEPDSIIVKSSMAGFDYSEISEITELSVGAVAMRLSRAKEKLKKALSDEK